MNSGPSHREGTAATRFSIRGSVKSNIGPVGGDGEPFERGVVGGFVNYDAIERFRRGFLAGDRQ